MPFTDYIARFSVGGRTYDVLLHIKNAKQGDRYHYHTRNEIEVIPVDGSNGASAGTYQTGVTSIDSIPQTAQKVKPEAGIPQATAAGNVDPLIQAVREQGKKVSSQTAMEGQKNATTGEAAVKADTTLFDRGILGNLNRARAYFVEYAKAHFSQTVKNQETGKSIGISRNGIDKFLSGRIGVEKYASGFHIPELIERAHKIAQDTNTHTI